MFTASQIITHLVGDYLLQSDWMATEKTKPGKAGWLAATVHGIVYTLPFIFLMHFDWSFSILAFLLIAGTHAVIDHYRLARYIGWVKNSLAPPYYNLPWRECSKTGYPEAKPAWMAVWLLIITDNTIHILINGLILGFCDSLGG